MVFSVDKSRVKEGDIVEVRWNCPLSEDVKLTINNGYKASSVAVEQQGSKRFRLNRSNGNTIISLDASVKGRVIHKDIKVKVKPAQFDSYERLDNNSFKGWSNKIGAKLRTMRSRVKYSWSVLPPQKRQAYISLLIIFVIMIVTSFYPKAIFMGMSLLSIYLLWTLLKR